MKTKRILLSILAILLAFAMCFVMTACKNSDSDSDKKNSGGRGESSPEDVADEFMKALYDDHDASGIIDLFHKDVIELGFVEDDVDMDEVEEDLQDIIDDEFEDISAEWEVSYVEDIEDYDFEDIAESYLDDYDLEIEELKLVEIDVIQEYELSGEIKYDDEYMEIGAVKIDGRWYLDIGFIAEWVY